jgi:hypothetical protein
MKTTTMMMLRRAMFAWSRGKKFRSQNWYLFVAYYAWRTRRAGVLVEGRVEVTSALYEVTNGSDW